jgi:general secretion pathway protein D
MKFVDRPPGRLSRSGSRERVRIIQPGTYTPIRRFVVSGLGPLLTLSLFLILSPSAIGQSPEAPARQLPPTNTQPPPPVPQPVSPAAPPPSAGEQASPGTPPSPSAAQPIPPAKEQLPKPVKERQITLDFNNVDLPVFVKFVSEIVGKNFIIDERVRGKVTIFSPTKISVDKVYQVFLSVLDIKGLTAVGDGEMIQILPSTEVPPERNINVYYLENANAEETAKLLTSLVTRAGGPPAARRPVVQKLGEFEGSVQIIPDKATNALIITASDQDFEKLKDVIQKLDVRRRQVYVEAVIMEVAEDKLRELGTELGAVGAYQNNNQSVTILGGFNQDPTDIANLPDIPGLDVGLSTVNIRVLLKALQSSNDVNILSTPQILTSNNQKAKIVVAQNVPFVTGSSATPGGVTQRTVSRQDVGVTLELTPEILEGDRVRMDVRQEISTLQDTPTAILIELGPTTNKREASTTIVVPNNQTVVIGGLMRDDVSRVESKIPLLGDIPLIGWFFKTRTNHITKANLLIFLTPHVLHDKDEMDAILKQKGDTIRAYIHEGTLKGQTLSEQFLDSINPPTDKR